jgi:hypothetical protein
MAPNAATGMRVGSFSPHGESGQNVEVTEHSREAVAERLRRRYPRSRLPRPVIISLVALGAILAGWWLVDTAWQRARPPAAGDVSAFHVESDTRIDVTMRVDRPDPSRAATCRLIAQAQDLAVVGEQAVAVPAGDRQRVDLRVTLVTLRRAVSASVRGCTVP